MREELEDIEEEDSVRTKAFSAFKKDFKAAKTAKEKGINDLISGWNDLYYGKSKVENKNRSQIVMREIAKQIEFQKPNITEPFLSTSHPVRVTFSKKTYVEKYLNTHFTGVFNRDGFIEQLVDVKLREGTAWVRSGWKSTKKTEEKVLTMDEILAIPEEPTSIESNGDGTFSVEYETLDENHGTARVCRNEHCYPDPGAKTLDEMQFFAEKRMVTISDLRKTGFYSEDKIDELVSKLSDKNSQSGGNSLEYQRDGDGEEYGQDYRHQTEDDPRKKVSIIEYWGYYDLNGDGITEPILATWAEHEDVNLELTENPLPRQNIPYYNDVYSARPFSLWGNALAYFIGDNQRVKTGIMRGIIDNMSLANNGQKFIKKGTLDYINFKRMRNGERHIVVNKADGIEDGTFNQLPSSIFNTLSMVTQETEQLAGTNASGPSLSNDSLSKEDTGSMQMTMSQQRMAALVRSTSNTICKIMKDWITMAEVFLDNSQIDDLFSEDEQTDFFALKGSNKAVIALKVGTDVNRTVKMQQLNMLLQQSKQLGQSVPPDTFNELVAEMFELFNMYDKAEELRKYKPEPNPMQQKAQMLELQKLELANQKTQVEIQASMSDIENNRVLAQNKTIDSQAGAMYKQAQTGEKVAKAESHQVDTALKPAQVIAEMQEKAIKKQETERRTI